MPKLPASDVARLESLGDGWEDSDAPVSINARDAEALGFPLDQHEISGEPLGVATVTGRELHAATRNLPITAVAAKGAAG